MSGKNLRTATFAIFAVTVAVWVLGGIAVGEGLMTATMGFIPARLSGLLPLPGAFPAWLTPLSATLVHAGALHIFMNMVMLAWCGFHVERVLGAASLVLLYVVGAYAAAIAQWAFDPGSITPMVGASGAISAVIGAFALSFGRPKRISNSPALNRWLNSLWLLAAWVVLQAMIGWLAGGQGVLLATPAHVGGFVAGLALQRPLLLWRYRSA